MGVCGGARSADSATGGAGVGSAIRCLQMRFVLRSLARLFLVDGSGVMMFERWPPQPAATWGVSVHDG